MSFKKNNAKNESNYELSTLENQEYLFKNKFYKQELLAYEENKDRLVSYILYSYLILITN